MADQEIRYRLAQSVVRIDGTVTHTPLPGGGIDTSRASNVQLAVEAARDPESECVLRLAQDGWRDRELDVKLAADERLTGLNSKSTGQGAAVVLAAVRIGAMAVKAYGKLPLLRTTRGGLARGGDGEADENDRQEQAGASPPADEAALEDRLAQYDALTDSLADSLDQLARGIADGSAAADALDRIKAVQAALAATRDQRATVAAELSALREGRYPPVVEKHSYSIPTDILPVLPRDEPEPTFARDELPGTIVKEVAASLGVVVALIDDDDDPHTQPEDSEGVLFRRPRLVQIGVYEELPRGAASDKYRRVSIQHAWVVDSRSSYGVLRIGSGPFSERTAGADFGEAGTLVHLTNKESGAAGQIAKVAEGLAGGITGGVDDVDKIAKALAGPSDPAPDPLKELKDSVEKAKLEAALAKARKEKATASNGLPKQS